MKKKIIYTIDTLVYGGAEKSTLEIVSNLSSEFEPVIVTFYSEKKQFPWLDAHNIRLININLQGKYDFVQGIKTFKQICKQEKPDLIVATLFRSEIISRIVAKQLGIKIIGTFVSDTYSPAALKQFTKSQLIKIRALQLLNRYTAKFCTRFISNADSIRMSNARALNVPPEKVDVVYRGRDVSRFSAEKNKKSDQTFRFVNVGRLRSGKGQADIIKAFANFHIEYPNSTLDIAGEGPERSKLEALIEKHQLKGKVRLLGNVSDIPKFLTQYDVFVFASHYEGFSGALVEALLAGIPVVASDIPMNTEAVEHLQTGYVFRTGNITSLTQAMHFAVNNYTSMNEMSVRARAVAKDLYDLGTIVKQHEVIYRNCIESSAVLN